MITLERIQQFIAFKGEKSAAGKLASTTIKRNIVLLNFALKFAYQARLLDHMPLRDCDELQVHDIASGIECTHTNISLLAALGNSARHLGQFAESRLVGMAASCQDIWERAVA